MIRRVAVIGAGVMGHGIAEVYALAGFPVALVDTRADALEAAIRSIGESLSLLADEGLVTREAARAAAARVEPTADLARAVTAADLVTESIPEVLEEKLALVARLEPLLGGEAILASNTSTFPITRLAARALRPGRMVVTHFFNPAQLVPLVEVLPHPDMTAADAERVLDLMRRIGKRPVLLRREVPGFVANRLQAALAREAFHLVEEGVIDAREVDAVVTEGPGFRWALVGPLEAADLGGLDTWRRVLDNLAPELSAARAAPSAVVERVGRGELGAKAGKGLYAWDPAALRERIRERDLQLARLLRLKRASSGG